MDISTIGNEIISVAGHFAGLHETAANAAWDRIDTPGADPEGKELRAALEAVGWQAGWPYCAAFCEAVWRKAYSNLNAPPELIKEIASKLTPSVMSSFNNWDIAKKISKDPQPGAIFFMQLNKKWSGHAGIVVKPGAGKMATIEGNTSPDPANPEADRNGDGVYKRVRTLDFTPHSGLWLRGVLNPITW